MPIDSSRVSIGERFVGAGARIVREDGSLSEPTVSAPNLRKAEIEAREVAGKVSDLFGYELPVEGREGLQ